MNVRCLRKLCCLLNRLFVYYLSLPLELSYIKCEKVHTVQSGFPWHRLRVKVVLIFITESSVSYHTVVMEEEALTLLRVSV